MLKFNIITLFPDFFESPLKSSLLGRACREKLIEVDIHNLRDFALNSYNKVDDSPYGGGAGMILMIEPIDLSVRKIKKKEATHVILLSPRGESFDQSVAKRLFDQSQNITLSLICGHYEGVDQRVADEIADESISIGNYILSGGEPAALSIMDSISRLIPGFMGNPESLKEESFCKSGYIEYPQYTRPADYKGLKVPDILFSGNHEKIREWRNKNANKKG